MTSQQDVDTAALTRKYPDALKFCGLTPERLLEEIARRDALDPHFTRIWLEYLSHHHNRPGLDTRSRLLALTGMFTVTRSPGHLEDVLRAALGEGLSGRELLEVIVQASVYAGDVASAPALETFDRVIRDTGRLGDLDKGRLPLDGRDSERDLESERATWDPVDQADPRLSVMLERLPWQAVSTGLGMKPQHHLNVLQFLDGIDHEHTYVWMQFTYQGMYSRAILDERTRLLCIVANFVALSQANEIKEHMGNALRAGVTASEIKELCLLSSIYFGMPGRSFALRILIEVLKSRGQLDQLEGAPGA